MAKNTEHTTNIKKESFYNYLCDILFISIAVLIYHYIPFYKTFLTPDTHREILVLAAGYAILGFPYYLYYGGSEPSKSRIIVRGIIAFFKSFKEKKKKKKKREEEDGRFKTAILFILVKFFYLPLMINFVFGHLNDFRNADIGIIYNYDRLYLFILNLFFFIDTIYYAFGYSVESKALNNEVKSVEPTLFGWAVALACYPPFNNFSGALLPWQKSDLVTFNVPAITFICRLLVIILTGIYLWATIALGTKCSNLTNRGIVARGPYAYVRHPAYISKNLSWWIMSLPYLTINNILFGLGWALIYYLRAITEEWHLSKDPDYKEYCKKVKWKFIPKVW